MTVELTEDERDTLLVALGMAAAVSMREGGDIKPLQRIIAKLAPDSYWALHEVTS